MAEEVGCSKAEAKEHVQNLKRLYQVWKTVQITEGYELTVTGWEDQPIRVYKINGRWVSDISLSIVRFVIPVLQNHGFAD